MKIKKVHLVKPKECRVCGNMAKHHLLFEIRVPIRIYGAEFMKVHACASCITEALRK